MNTTGSSLLREWRKREGLTQFQAAIRLGCDPTQLSRWERGSRPALPNAIKLEQEAGVPVTAWEVVDESGGEAA
jgi:transcriptional regulator with XRE-family HTH domain